MTRYDLQKLGESLSHEYLKNQTSLTELLEKTAQELDLNHHQIERVAEAANVETYLKLMNKTAGYIEFPLARPEKVKAGEKTAHYHYNSQEISPDYDLDWTQHYEKLAYQAQEEVVLDEIDQVNERVQTRVYEISKLAELKDKVADQAARVDQVTTKLSYLVEQYVYSNSATPEQVGQVIKTASNIYGDQLQKLARLEPQTQVTAKVQTRIDEQSDLYKLAHLAATELQALNHAKQQFETKHAELSMLYPQFTKPVEKSFNLLLNTYEKFL